MRVLAIGSAVDMFLSHTLREHSATAKLGKPDAFWRDPFSTWSSATGAMCTRRATSAEIPARSQWVSGRACTGQREGRLPVQRMDQNPRSANPTSPVRRVSGPRANGLAATAWGMNPLGVAVPLKRHETRVVTGYGAGRPDRMISMPTHGIVRTPRRTRRGGLPANHVCSTEGDSTFARRCEQTAS